MDAVVAGNVPRAVWGTCLWRVLEVGMERKCVVIGLLVACAFAMASPTSAQGVRKGVDPPKGQRGSKSVRLLGAPPIAAAPLRMARVRADGSLAEPWRPVVGLDWPNDPWFTAFDCFEADPGNVDGRPYDGGYGVNYNEPGSGDFRYFFGPSFQNMFCANDLRTTSGFAAGRAERTSFAWYWNGQAGERCIVIIQTWDRFGFTDAGIAPNTSTGQFLSGFAFDFGTGLTPGSPLFAGVNLAAPDFFALPVDGSGAYTMTIAKNLVAGSPPVITLATTAQPMLWFTKPLNPSFQGPLQWDDDNPADFVHRTNPPGPAVDVELYDYTDSVEGIPVPLGAMVAFYSHAQIVNPTSYVVLPGLDLGGGLASLLASDDVTLHTRVDLSADRAGHQIQLLLNSASPVANPSSLEFVVEDQVNLPGVMRFVKLWNYTNSVWEVLDARLISTSVSTIAAPAGGSLARFVQAGTQNLRAMVGYDLVASDQNRAWDAWIDLAVFRIGHPSTSP